MRNGWIYNIAVRVVEFGERHRWTWLVKLALRLKWWAEGK